MISYQGTRRPDNERHELELSERLKVLLMVKTLNVFLSRKESTRLLRDSHLDLKIETRKENSHLILNLDSQFCCENSHSHSQLSFSNSQKFETSFG